MDKDAFELADTIRYKDDFRVETFRFESDRTKLTELGLSLESLKVTEDITPTIDKALKQACKNLHLDFNKVVVYITPSSDIQAQCISFSKDSCIITLSSNLCNLLNSDEIIFVIGHELGHFLLSHTIENIISSKETNDYYDAAVKSEAIGGKFLGVGGGGFLLFYVPVNKQNNKLNVLDNLYHRAV